jgi:hypothetical protein
MTIRHLASILKRIKQPLEGQPCDPHWLHENFTCPVCRCGAYCSKGIWSRGRQRHALLRGRFLYKLFMHLHVISMSDSPHGCWSASHYVISPTQNQRPRVHVLASCPSRPLRARAEVVAALKLWPVVRCARSVEQVLCSGFQRTQPEFVHQASGSRPRLY